MEKNIKGKAIDRMKKIMKEDIRKKQNVAQYRMTNRKGKLKRKRKIENNKENNKDKLEQRKSTKSKDIE